MIKILHLIKTKSYKSDGRLLKWIESLKHNLIKSEVIILEDSNIKEVSNVDETLIQKQSLFFRKFFRKRRGYLFKIPEYTIKSIFSIRKSNADMIVFHDVQHYLTLLILIFFKFRGEKKIIWDLHELPHSYLVKNIVSRKIIKYILENVDLVVYTNSQRREWVLKSFGHSERSYTILNNFPDAKYIKADKTQLPTDLNNWLRGKSFVLWMGAANVARNFAPVLKSLIDYKHDVKLVVMGSIESNIQRLIVESGLKDFVFSKFVSQDEIINYVDNALFSIVLYKQSSPNNLYCEPNRLYQLLTRRVPVIVGDNPPMRDTLRKFGGGVILEDDGSNPHYLKNAINKIVSPESRKRYISELNSTNFEKEMCWNTQFSFVFEKIKLLK